MTLQELTACAETAATPRGCWIVDVSVAHGDEFTIVLDKEAGDVEMEDCVAVNNAVLAAFDRDTEDYALTVTSAGLDLPFRDLRQYRKHLGERVEALLRDGRKLTAELKAASEDGVTLAWTARESVPGMKKKQPVAHEQTFPFEAVNAVRPYIEFK